MAPEAERLHVWTELLTGLELDEQGGMRFLDADEWEQRRARLAELGGAPEGLPGG